MASLPAQFLGILPVQGVQQSALLADGDVILHRPRPDAGNRLLRALLVEVAWLMRRYNPYLRAVFEQVCRGVTTRRKIAVLAVSVEAPPSLRVS